MGNHYKKKPTLRGKQLSPKTPSFSIMSTSKRSLEKSDKEKEKENDSNKRARETTPVLPPRSSKPNYSKKSKYPKNFLQSRFTLSYNNLPPKSSQPSQWSNNPKSTSSTS